MNEVSIIINGVRYDAVEVNGDRCDLYDDDHGCPYCIIGMETCEKLMGGDGIFKKSNKKFER